MNRGLISATCTWRVPDELWNLFDKESLRAILSLSRCGSYSPLAHLHNYQKRHEMDQGFKISNGFKMKSSSNNLDLTSNMTCGETKLDVRMIYFHEILIYTIFKCVLCKHSNIKRYQTRSFSNSSCRNLKNLKFL